VVKKISFLEIFKMIVSHAAFNSDKTEIFQTNSLLIQSKRKVHFQIDGEYIGKVNEVDASIIPSAISIIVPEKIIINY
jgi:diacylglycerol kinase family enzyme